MRIDVKGLDMGDVGFNLFADCVYPIAIPVKPVVVGHQM
jgi:hypothetical protein